MVSHGAVLVLPRRTREGGGPSAHSSNFGFVPEWLRGRLHVLKFSGLDACRLACVCVLHPERPSQSFDSCCEPTVVLGADFSFVDALVMDYRRRFGQLPPNLVIFFAVLLLAKRAWAYFGSRRNGSPTHPYFFADPPLFFFFSFFL